MSEWISIEDRLPIPEYPEYKAPEQPKIKPIHVLRFCQNNDEQEHYLTTLGEKINQIIKRINEIE